MNFDASVRAELAPTRHLRAPLNVANPLLSRSNTLSEVPAGLTIDLSRELARRLDVELTFLQWSSPGQSVQALVDGIADVGYLAVDAKRGRQVHFTSPY